MTTANLPGFYSNRLRVLGWGSALALLSLPAIAMQVGAEGVDWSASDFLVFGGMLLVLGLGLEVAIGRSGDRSYRLGAAIALFGNFLLLWVNLAVGIFGPETDAPNLAFLAVPLLGIAGAVIGGGRAATMAKTMAASAAVQLALGAAGVVLATGYVGSDFRPLGLLTLAFTIGWSAAAVLFKRAANRA